MGTELYIMFTGPDSLLPVLQTDYSDSVRKDASDKQKQVAQELWIERMPMIVADCGYLSSNQA